MSVLYLLAIQAMALGILFVCIGPVPWHFLGLLGFLPMFLLQRRGK